MTTKNVKMGNGAETTEEIIGVLTAISVISKRMARKLAMLEKLNESEEKNVRKSKPSD
ncbi:MAG: hypothetical protein LBM93_03065 [Oscillospiraceae bacterium]|jgi:hypothetical protein|nr:hypothetical protein [Oscillospiraceae bacterium]